MAPQRLSIRVDYTRSDAPFVMFVVAGKSTPFTVDTGTPFTSVNRATVESWGLADAIQPCDDEYYEGTVLADVNYDVDDTVRCTVAHSFRFYVLDCARNLLGLDFLTATRSDLKLDLREPLLYIY